MAWECVRVKLNFPLKGFQMIKDLKEDYKNDAAPGDLLMVEIHKWFYHAGVYCKHGGIIHLTKHHSGLHGSLSSSSAACSSHNYISEFCRGYVSTMPMKDFLGGMKFKMFRKPDLSLDLLESNISRVMQTEHEYNLFKYNCIHFALSLFRVDPSTQPDSGAASPESTELQPLNNESRL